MAGPVLEMEFTHAEASRKLQLASVSTLLPAKPELRGVSEVSNPSVNIRLLGVFSLSIGERRVERHPGCAFADDTVREGRRRSIFRSYLHPRMAEPKITVLTGALVWMRSEKEKRPRCDGCEGASTI